MTNRPASFWLVSALIVAAVVLVEWNWLLRPGRAAVWALALLMSLVVGFVWIRAARRPVPGSGGSPSRAPAAGWYGLAALSIVLALATSLARSLGIADRELAMRGQMIVLGAILVYSGNIVPKSLRPLSAQRCDPARAQAAQRLAGWTWVLSGLGFILAWIVLPTRLAEPVSIALVAMGTILIAGQCLGRPRAARRT